ncbi:MAG: hypothetical protein H6Q89_5516 [Myxococcaceae bacterium]|nr:hypothetical protein [Myxococcaceae bacterium]
MATTDLESRFATFFQAFWLSPDPAGQDRLIGFHGEAPAFSAVLREASRGRPLAVFRTELQAGSAVLDLQSWMTNGESIVLTLFGEQSDADLYFAQSRGGWTQDELAVLADRELLSMMPDVNFIPQYRVREARNNCDPTDPQSVLEMNARLVADYQRFARFDGRVVPEVAPPGLKGLLIAAPGHPPEWIPPD